ncbi:Predicted permease [Marinomonas sp. MED121]|uniref:sulfite exporter TauE/SafE family protein n=1 Tax=Marinomonas sp. MED121 TaxID=314277 RepID=UPI00006910CB|nr:sulfite exporter TauE/SafE family protein [Marinomonas sp. MED121]EAQ67805.1 Predicted permease [Marinomonas sp. MED121]
MDLVSHFHSLGQLISATASVQLSIFLILIASFTSFVTAVFGAGGGVMMLGVMAQVLPPQVIIPLHGVVQLGSNSGRALMSWRYIDWRLMTRFLPGAILGIVLGSLLLVSLSPAVIYLTIAIFILYLCWGPKLPKLILGSLGTGIAAAVTSFITLFVGASGPLVGAFIKQLHTCKFTTVATFAAAMSCQHLLKISVFHQAGFPLLEWLPLLVCMILSGAIGTFIGLRILQYISDKSFELTFNLILTALALRMVWQAWEAF